MSDFIVPPKVVTSLPVVKERVLCPDCGDACEQCGMLVCTEAEGSNADTVPCPPRDFGDPEDSCPPSQRPTAPIYSMGINIRIESETDEAPGLTKGFFNDPIITRPGESVLDMVNAARDETKVEEK